MTIIQKLRKNILYLFIALPFILLGYESFMALSIGSRSWSILFVGQLMIVPLLATALSVIFNDVLKDYGWYRNLITIIYMILSIIPLLIYVGYSVEEYKATHGGALPPAANLTSNLPGGWVGWGIFSLLAIPALIVALYYTITNPNKILDIQSHSSGFFKHPVQSIIDIFKFPVDSLLEFFKNNQAIEASDVCGVIPGTKSVISRVPSLYLAHIAFFVGYLITNAKLLYNQSSDKDILNDNRRNRTNMIIIVAIVSYILLVVSRAYLTKCESALGLFFTSSIFMSLGFTWYKLAEACGARNSDLLGISTSILPDSAKKTPVVCASWATAN